MNKRNQPRPAAHSLLNGEQRINKVLAAAGLGSRRQVDELIEQGRVEVDGKTVQQVGVKVNPETVQITVDGEPLKKHRPVYFALNKPEGVLCTNRDPQGRPRVVDMVPNQVRLFPVGRLDASSTGLILLTNDGEIAQRLTHPRHGVPKRYAVVVAGQVEADSLRRLQRGIHLAEGRAKVDHAKLKRIRKGCTELEITLSEGKNREIRRVLARLGHNVVSLKRIGIGPLKLGELPEGAYRPLGTLEINALYEAVEAIKRERKQERKERKKEAEKPKETRTSKQPKARAATTEKPEDFALPPLKDNPYHTDEDLDDEQNPFGDESILVRDTQGEMDDDWTPTSSRRVGAVIGDEEEVVPNDERRRDRGTGRDRGKGRDGGTGRGSGKGRGTGKRGGAGARGDSVTRGDSGTRGGSGKDRTTGRPPGRTKSASGRPGGSEQGERREGRGGAKKKGFGRPGIKAARKGRPSSKKRKPKGR